MSRKLCKKYSSLLKSLKYRYNKHHNVYMYVCMHIPWRIYVNLIKDYKEKKKRKYVRPSSIK